MYHSKWLLPAILVLLSACSGGLDKRELRVDVNFPEEFERGLPEFIAFGPGGECLYHSFGFSSEGNFLMMMEQVLAGNKIEQKVPPRETLEEAIRESVYGNESIPEDQKETVIAASVEKSLIPKPRCVHGLEYYGERFETADGGDFSIDSLPRGKSIFIEHYADWCVPCKKQEDALERFAETRGDEFVLLKVERDLEKALSQ